MAVKSDNYYEDDIIELKNNEEKLLDYSNLTYTQSLKLEGVKNFIEKQLDYYLPAKPYTEAKLDYLYNLFINNIYEEDPPAKYCFCHVLYFDNLANKMDCNEHPKIQQYMEKIYANPEFSAALLQFYLRKRGYNTSYIRTKIIECLIKCVTIHPKFPNIMIIRGITWTINELFDRFYTYASFSFYKLGVEAAIVLKNKNAIEYFRNKF